MCWTSRRPAARRWNVCGFSKQRRAAERIALLVSESRYGMGMAELVARTGMLEADIRKAAARRAIDGPPLAAILGSGSRRGWLANWKRCMRR